MNNHINLSPLKNFKNDIPASIVVFLVALPLCLGIALVSGAPLYAGIIGGIVGGIIVGSLSGSSLGVSGPAAGLAVIVLNAITDLGGFEIFLVAVILAGIIQVFFGFAKAGTVAYYFPSSVIHGMLAGIGILIFLKQIPHAFGYDSDPEGDFKFFQTDGQNTFSGILNVFDNINYGVTIVSLLSLAILILWQSKLLSNFKFTKIIQGPLMVVITGILLTKVFSDIPTFKIGLDHLVSLPAAGSMQEFFGNFTFPDFSAFLNPQVYVTAILIAVVASLETLLSVEATDKQDPLKRITPTNRELKAQGVGNIISGLIGGLPVTQVIVRSSANMQSGGKTKASTVIHGFLLIISIITIPNVLNLIPLGSLAAILIIVGFKLAKPSLFKKMYKQGKGQFGPFVVTILGIVFTDLLTGIVLGMVVAVSVILYNNLRIPYKLNRQNLEGRENVTIKLSEDVTFLNKASILRTLEQIPDDTHVVIDASNSQFIHCDIIEIIEDFVINAKTRNIDVKIIELYKKRPDEAPTHFDLANGDSQKVA